METRIMGQSAAGNFLEDSHKLVLSKIHVHLLLL